MVLGSIVAYLSRSIQSCAARPPVTTHCATRSLGARSSPRRSGASATLWPAVERFFASPCPPTNIVLGAGHLRELFAALLARLQPAGSPETAPPTLRRARLELVGLCSLWRGGEHLVPRLVSALWVACVGDPGGY